MHWTGPRLKKVKGKGQQKLAPMNRSQIMAQIRAWDTTPELAVRSYLWARNVRYKLRQIIGHARPDIAWKSKRVAVFIDGCFWHGCPMHCRRPATRQDYWNPKIDRNMEHDIETTALLRSSGWKVLRFWEHEVTENIDNVGLKILVALRKSPPARNKGHR